MLGQGAALVQHLHKSRPVCQTSLRKSVPCIAHKSLCIGMLRGFGSGQSAEQTVRKDLYKGDADHDRGGQNSGEDEDDQRCGGVVTHGAVLQGPMAEVLAAGYGCEPLL